MSRSGVHTASDLSGVPTCGRRGGLTASELEFARAKRRMGAGWQGVAAMLGRSVSDVREACEAVDKAGAARVGSVSATEADDAARETETAPQPALPSWAAGSPIWPHLTSWASAKDVAEATGLDLAGVRKTLCSAVKAGRLLKADNPHAPGYLYILVPGGSA